MKDDKKTTPSRYGIVWWAKNIVAAIAAYALCALLLKYNTACEWLVKGYAIANTAAMRQLSDYTADEKLEAKLGSDYLFIEMIRWKTPPDAVVFYPSRVDFLDNSRQKRIVFSGNLCDKLTAVRFLYPRRIVVEQELGKTTWSRRLTHVAIVNGHGRELLPYRTDSLLMIGVMPMNPMETVKKTAK